MREYMSIAGLKQGEVSDSDWSDWRWQLKKSVTTATMLSASAGCGRVEAVYPARVTPYYLGLADLEDPSDPVLRQCLPQAGELSDDDACSEDPFQEEALSPVPGLVQRYPDRALVMLTSMCAVNCRHCTRKNMLHRAGEGAAQLLTPTSTAGKRVLEHLESNAGIREVILSGGDPLLLEDSALDAWLAALQAIRHIAVLRIGSRVPVVMPMRVDDSLADLLAGHRPLWVNTQFNHPRELTAEALAACERLISRGIPVSNQAVLLRGVNDDIAVMRRLCNELQRHMIRPYYVFLCDPVKGTCCFTTGVKRAREIADALEVELGGLAKPRFVADVPGAPGKMPVSRIPVRGED